MIKIEISSTTVEERQGTGKNNKAYHMREQGAYAYVLDEQGKPGKYPVQCSVPLELDQPPYQPGFYTLDPRAVYVGDFKKLSLGRVRLVPLQAAPAAKAA